MDKEDSVRLVRGRGRGRGSRHNSVGSQPSTSTGGGDENGRVCGVQDEPRGQSLTSTVEPEVSGQYEDSEGAVMKGIEKIALPSLPTLQDIGTPPLRPGVGTRGRQIALIANHFSVDLPRGELYQYDLTIKTVGVKFGKSNQGANGLGKRVCILVFEQMVKRTRDELFQGMFPVFDGMKVVILRNRLKDDAYNFRISKVQMDGDDEADFDVTLIFTAAINLEPLHKLFRWVDARKTPEKENAMLKWKERNKDDISHAILALNIILRHSSLFSLVPVGRNFFMVPEPGQCHPLSGGREVWHGYHQSLRPGWKPFVIIDKVMTTFYKPNQNLVDFVAEVLGRNKEGMNFLKDHEVENVNRELKNIKIEVTHLPYKRKFTVNSCCSKSPREITFKIENEKTRVMTVEEYFRSSYGMTLQFPNLPCIDVGRQRYIPMEVCQLVANQPCNKKLTSQQTAEMLKVATVRPLERFAAIKDLSHATKEQSKDILKEFDISLSEDPAKIFGRVLEAPQIQYQMRNQLNQISPRDGVWDMRNKQFQKGAKIRNWALLSFAESHVCNENHLTNLTNLLCDISKNAGLCLGPCSETFKTTYSRPGDAQKILEDLKKMEFDLLVIVIPKENSQECYSEVKTVADTMLGLVTQCVRCENVASRKCQAQFVSNLCLKINAKLGGINNSPISSFLSHLNEKPIVYMGADVTHPSPDDKTSPSVAAVVASLDGYPSQHAVEIKVQKAAEQIKSRVEIILGLKDMVKRLLRAFYSNTRQKPEKIIFYRDGVSEGQFREVRNYEIQAIRQACSELQSDYQPKITFIIVQKRHHTRFYPGDPKERGRTGNVPAGTVVDQSITHPSDFDFFLCSHYGLQGTSRPTHYFVLWDDNDYDADTLQAMTYGLCYAYVRCTRSISIPAQTMYAHLAAFRARHYLRCGIQRNVDISEVVRVANDMANKMYFV